MKVCWSMVDIWSFKFVDNLHAKRKKLCVCCAEKIKSTDLNIFSSFCMQTEVKVAKKLSSVSLLPYFACYRLFSIKWALSLGFLLLWPYLDHEISLNVFWKNSYSLENKILKFQANQCKCSEVIKETKRVVTFHPPCICSRFCEMRRASPQRV